MSEAKKNEAPKPIEKPRKPTLYEMQQQLNKMKHVFESLPHLLEERELAAREARAIQIQELQGARARLIKPDDETKKKAIADAHRVFDSTVAKAKAQYEAEIAPAKKKLDDTTTEAAKELDTQIEAARTKFNKAAEELLVAHKNEVSSLDTKFDKALKELKSKFETEQQELCDAIGVLESEISKLQAKVQQKNGKDKPVEKTA